MTSISYFLQQISRKSTFSVLRLIFYLFLFSVVFFLDLFNEEIDINYDLTVLFQATSTASFSVSIFLSLIWSRFNWYFISFAAITYMITWIYQFRCCCCYVVSAGGGSGCGGEAVVVVVLAAIVVLAGVVTFLAAKFVFSVDEVILISISVLSYCS